VVRREALRRIPGVAGKARVDTGHLQIVIDRPTGKPPCRLGAQNDQFGWSESTLTEHPVLNRWRFRGESLSYVCRMAAICICGRLSSDVDQPPLATHQIDRIDSYQNSTAI
jgi:hypothetical protein